MYPVTTIDSVLRSRGSYCSPALLDGLAKGQGGHTEKGGEGEHDEDRRQALGVIRNFLPKLLVKDSGDVAVSALKEHCRYYTTDAESYVLLARVLEFQHRYTEALDTLRIACFLCPQNITYRQRLRCAEREFLKDHRISARLKLKCYTASAEYEKLFSAQDGTGVKGALAAKRGALLARFVRERARLSETKARRGAPLDKGDGAAPLEDNVTVCDDETEGMHTSGHDDEDDEEGRCEKRWRCSETFPFVVLATHAIPCGTVIARERPFAVAPLLDADHPRLFATCFHCLRERRVPDKAFACPLYPKTCPFVFCSAACVLANVNVHRQECEFITSIVFPLAKECGFTPGFILLLLRAMIRAFIERSLRPTETEDMRFFFRLYTHTVQEPRDWIRHAITQLAQALTQLLPLEFRLCLSRVELEQFILMVHAFAINITYEPPAVPFQHTAPVVALGLALAPSVCSFPHSCMPNACYAYTPEGMIVARALEAIEPQQPICISYVEDLMLPTFRRKHPDTSAKVITCRCLRCVTTHEHGRFTRGQRCPVCVQGVRKPPQGTIMKLIVHSLEHQKKRLYARGGPDTHPVTYADASDTDPWVCTQCGPLSAVESSRCDALEIDAATRMDGIREHYGKGKRVKAMRLCESFMMDYALVLHSNHYTLYNGNLYFTGLLSGQCQTERALMYLTRALHAMHAVCPAFHPEKIHLYTVYSNLLLKSDAPLSALEAMWIAVANAWFTRGPGSYQWIAALTRLRYIARLLNTHTPPTLYTPALRRSTHGIVRQVKKLLRLPRTRSLSAMIARDHQFIVFSACVGNETGILKHIFSAPSAVRRELECHNLMTGFTALGTAACASHPVVLRSLLYTHHVDLFPENEFHMTPLLAMASRRYVDDATDEKQAEICRIMCRYADSLESELHSELQNNHHGPMLHKKLGLSPSTSLSHQHTAHVSHDVTPFFIVRNLLLLWRSHWILGHNTAAHYAAANGKEKLLFQFVCEGVPLDIRNGEYATPLHLACLNGFTNIVARMLKLGCPCDPRNSREQTPLMLACYNLHADVIQLLLQSKANVLHCTSDTFMTCVHALVLGVTKTHVARYLGSNQESHDSVIGMLMGMNPHTADVVYDTVRTFRHTSSVSLTAPVHERCFDRVFLVPDHFQTRLKKAQMCIDVLYRSDSNMKPLLSQRLRGGLTPCELLKARIDLLVEKHQDVWGESKAKLPPSRRAEARSAWRSVLAQFDDLVDILSPTPEPPTFHSNPLNIETRPRSPEPVRLVAPPRTP